MKCHYCKTYPAKTKDHIVPKSKLQRLGVPRWFRILNLVPCCLPCNNRKGDQRSDCNCEQCTWAWKIAEVFFLKEQPEEEVA